MVIPNRKPETIMFSILGSDEQDMTGYLSAYQKNSAEWDVFRKKIPQELLNKFKRVLDECKLEGFINPHVREGKIVWNQILTRERCKNATDKCTLCSKSFIAGDCLGKLRIINNQKRFIFCWQ